MIALAQDHSFPLAAWVHAASFAFAFCLIAPMIGARAVPISVRLLIAGGLATGLVGTQQAGGLVGLQHPNLLSLMHCTVAGLLAGGVLRLVWTVATTAATAVALAVGFSLQDALLNVGEAESHEPARAMLETAALAGLLASGADRLIYATLTQAFTTLTQSLAPTSALAADLPALAASAFVILNAAGLAALFLVAPALAACCLAEFAIGLAFRLAAGPGFWLLAVPVRVAVGIPVLAVSTLVLFNVSSPSLLASLLGGTVSP